MNTGYRKNTFFNFNTHFFEKYLENSYDYIDDYFYFNVENIDVNILSKCILVMIRVQIL